MPELGCSKWHCDRFWSDHFDLPVTITNKNAPYWSPTKHFSYEEQVGNTWREAHKAKLFQMPAITGHISAFTVFVIRNLTVYVTIRATRCRQLYRSSAGISLYSGVTIRHEWHTAVRSRDSSSSWQRIRNTPWHSPSRLRREHPKIFSQGYVAG
jgi:hypothetical protein